VACQLPAAVLAVVQIPAHARSALPTILSNAGPWPAKSAEDGEPLGEGAVYVAPPDRHLLALKKDIFELGEPSRNSCPECHGSLIEIREGPIVRYRCHTGHAFAAGTLLAETDTAIETSFWSAVRHRGEVVPAAHHGTARA
jgi:hypothetical protein